MLKKLRHVTTISHRQEGLRVPPGQYITEKFPVLSYGSTPSIDLKTWTLHIFGLVEGDLSLNWDQFTARPQTAIIRDFHCVTQWSRMDNLWEGFPFREVAELAKPKPRAHFVMVHCYDGYTTNLPLDILMEEDVLFVHRHAGKLLEPARGGPMRLVVPNRYGWKSAKWVNGLEFMEQDRLGFWEQLGYHNNGDPWNEERFRPRL